MKFKAKSIHIYVTCKVQSWPGQKFQNICFRVECDLETRLGHQIMVMRYNRHQDLIIKYYTQSMKISNRVLHNVKHKVPHRNEYSTFIINEYLRSAETKTTFDSRFLIGYYIRYYTKYYTS